jgi:hypothetical protein
MDYMTSVTPPAKTPGQVKEQNRYPTEPENVQPNVDVKDMNDAVIPAEKDAIAKNLKAANDSTLERFGLGPVGMTPKVGEQIVK